MVRRTTDWPTPPRDLNAAALWRAGVHPAKTGLTGGGIVCCILDYGFDLLHPSLRAADGTTRFAALIDQNGATLTRTEIDRLLRKVDAGADRSIIDRLYDPHNNYFGTGGVSVGTHGTWVASIAAGTSLPGFTGLAPETTLIGVQLALPDHAWREIDLDAVMDAGEGWRSYDESPAIVAALEAAVAAAEGLVPDGIVINLSIGAWAGSHHVGAAVNRALSALAMRGVSGDGIPIFVIAGTGNAGAERGHFGGRLAPGRVARFAWHLAPDAASLQKLEVWSDGAVNVRLTPPAPFDEHSIALEDGGRAELRIAGRVAGIADAACFRDGPLRCARFWLDPLRLPTGPGAHHADRGGGRDLDFTVEVICTGTAHGPREIHAWLERDCSGPAAHLSPASRSATLTSLATAPGVISVAGLDEAANPLAMSGCGPAPWCAASASLAAHRPNAPALAAPAAAIWGARSKTTGFMRGSGTSAATAFVSGAMALALQAAAQAGRRLSRDDLLGCLTGASRQAWSPETGWGVLDFQHPIDRSRSDIATSGGFGTHPTTSEREEARAT